VVEKYVGHGVVGLRVLVAGCLRISKTCSAPMKCECLCKALTRGETVQWNTKTQSLSVRTLKC
jgi:hypothetical protein